MKLIVAGGREFKDYQLLKKTLDSVKSDITEIVSGNASGADSLGEKYAKETGVDIIIMPANWTKHKRSAGYIRNQKMAKYADALVAFWDQKSSGTKHMIDLAKSNNLKVWVVNYDS